MNQSYTYIITNQARTVLYVGVTSNLHLRIMQHKNGMGSEFTRKYKLKYLMYFEEFGDIRDAIFREKALKKMSRWKKDELISRHNPEWRDLLGF